MERLMSPMKTIERILCEEVFTYLSGSDTRDMATMAALASILLKQDKMLTAEGREVEGDSLGRGSSLQAHMLTQHEASPLCPCDACRALIADTASA